MKVVVMGAYEEIEDLLVYPAGGDGVALLAARPELAPKIADFLAAAIAAK